MAGQVVVKDVKALEEFASRIAKAKTELEQVARELNGALRTVSQVWQDPQKDKCAKEVESLVKAMAGFAKAADLQVSYCRRLAANVRSMP